MSAPLPFREFAAVCLPPGRRDGCLCMLAAYFDDSGTHGTSKVVVLGGVFGNQFQWEYFSELWKRKLDNPCPGKLPLRRFHMTDCQNSQHEFAGWKRHETDFLVRELGQIVLKCGLWGYAAAVSRADWDDLITGDVRRMIGDAEGFCIRNVYIRTLRWARQFGGDKNIAFVFDSRPHREKENTRVFDIFQWFQDNQQQNPQLVSATFASSYKILPLQAADLVAWEFYQHVLRILAQPDGNIELAPRKEFDHLLKGRISFGIATRAVVEKIARMSAESNQDFVKRAGDYIEAANPSLADLFGTELPP